MNFKSAYWPLLSLVFIGGSLSCGGGDEQTDSVTINTPIVTNLETKPSATKVTPKPEPTRQPTPTKIPPTATPNPRPTATPVPKPTSTMVPTATLIPVKLPTATLIPTKVPTATLTPVKLPTATLIPTKVPTATPVPKQVAIVPTTAPISTATTPSTATSIPSNSQSPPTPKPTSVASPTSIPGQATPPTNLVAMLTATPPPIKKTPLPMPTIMPTPDPSQNPLDPDSANPCAAVPPEGRKQCEEAIKNDPNFGVAAPKNSGFGKYAENFDPENIPQIANYNFTELEKFSRISKIRSGVGHDFSQNTPEYDPARVNCKSMKHYFIPTGVPRQNSLYSSTPHSFEWMSIKYFSPVNGTIEGVSYTENQYGKEANLTIGSSEYPGYYFKFFHVALDPNLTDGSTVQAGQQIGTIGDEESWGEIAVQVRIGINDNRLVSFLEVATDQVLQEYKDRGINVVTDVIVSRAQRDANPLPCDDSEAGWFIGSGRAGVPLDEAFVVWQFESSDNWFFFD